jgi:pyridoxamine 5'-phosphate oxidase
MTDQAERGGIFAGDDPFAIARAWLAEAEVTEINDPERHRARHRGRGRPAQRPHGAAEGHRAGAFVFYTNYESRKAQEIDGAGKAAFVMHWKSLRRQIRARGVVEKEQGPQADAYYRSRSLPSRLGAWASRQSRPLRSRAQLMAEVAKIGALKGLDPDRPPFWGGYRITPVEIEFWADGAHRLHDRFRWTRSDPAAPWDVVRLNP